MSNDVDPTEKIARIDGLLEGDDIRRFEHLGIRRAPEDQVYARRMSGEIKAEILMVGDNHSTETRAIAEHLAFSRTDAPDIIIVDEVGEWPERVRETPPTLNLDALTKTIQSSEPDHKVLEHRRYKARREHRQALTKNQLKTRRRHGVKGY